MPNSFEASVKGGTKVKLAPPKAKYIEHILLATQSGEAGVAEVFRTLTHRLRDSTWTVAFKSLIIVHMMIKEGARDVTLSYLAVSPSHRLATNNYTDVQTQGQNIRRYSEYLLARAKAYEKTEIDYVRSGDTRIRKLTVEKGLLRETEIVQDQIKALVKCNLLDTDVENEISLTAYRLLTRDLLDLFAVENEAVMRVLQHYFEMSKPDAERAVKIYRQFCKQTELVVIFLRTAQQYQHAMRLEIPKIKHAPVDLANTLQEYLDDKDFDIHRRQYLAQQEAKKTGKPVSVSTSSAQPSQISRPAVTNATSTPTSAQRPGPAPDLIDFFESIEQNQQPMAQPQLNGNGFVDQQQSFYAQPQTQFSPQQQVNPYLNNGMQQIQQPQVQPLPQNMTGQPFNAFPTAQQQGFPDQFSPIQQQPFAINQQPTAAPLQPQSTNPFRKSVMQPDMTGHFGAQQPIQPQNTNPFARSGTMPQVPAIPEQIQPIQPQRTGTNPFARTTIPQQQTAAATPPPLQMQPTGSTNPFRQSTFVNQATGGGWQTMQQPTMGGLEQLPTVPVFPRPGQGQPQQQASPWG